MGLILTAKDIVDVAAGGVGLGASDKQIKVATLKHWLWGFGNYLILNCPFEFLDHNVGYGTANSAAGATRFALPTNLNRFISLWTGDDTGIEYYDEERQHKEMVAHLKFSAENPSTPLYTYMKMGCDWCYYTPKSASAEVDFYKFLYLTKMRDVIAEGDPVVGDTDCVPGACLPIYIDMIRAIVAAMTQRPNEVALYVSTAASGMRNLHVMAGLLPPGAGATPWEQAIYRMIPGQAQTQ